MKLTDVIAIWNILHVKNTGDLGYCDLQAAVDEVVGIENDVMTKEWLGAHGFDPSEAISNQG